MNEQSMTQVVKEVTGASIGWAVVMIVLGFAAVFLPFAAGIGVSILVSWIIVFSGFAYIGYAFAAQGAGTFLWRMLIGIAYVFGGGNREPSNLRATSLRNQLRMVGLGDQGDFRQSFAPQPAGNLGQSGFLSA